MAYSGGATQLDQLPGGVNPGMQDPYMQEILDTIDMGDQNARMRAPPPQRIPNFQEPMVSSEYPPRMGPPQEPKGSYVSEPGGQYGQNGYNGQPQVQVQPQAPPAPGFFSSYMPNSIVDELKLPLVVAALFALGNLWFVNKTLARYLPRMVDQFGRETYTSLVVRAVIVAVVFYIIKKIFSL